MAWQADPKSLDFDSCMRSFDVESEEWTERKLKFGAWSAQDEDWLKTFKHIYSEDFVPAMRRSLDTEITSGPGRIPKVIHHIWLGSELPEHFKKLRQGWIDRHPGWELRLWDDTAVATELEEKPLKNMELYFCAKNFGEMSDVLRLEILQRYGGVYVDVDFECLGSLDQLVHSDVKMFCGLSNVGWVEINNGLIGSVAEHPIICECVDSLEIRDNQFMSEIMGTRNKTISKTGPGKFTRTISSWIHSTEPSVVKEASVVILPSSVLYPVPNTTRTSTLASRELPVSAYQKLSTCFSLAIHWW
eukprot:CAMPEP_0184304062 /NCGR_PEP_ID=MMETSP1049-20130417/13688_1 /TAXON_ID=77928 /ORGANISM="Proteomonas sulcata, Strain CCMP704" /LENGTH=301 /DNA_ID=CAMNT_0026615797 /DNA_START=97 /DNA_END=999 /DNA_ORIENTATION=+